MATSHCVASTPWLVQPQAVAVKTVWTKGLMHERQVLSPSLVKLRINKIHRNVKNRTTMTRANKPRSRRSAKKDRVPATSSRHRPSSLDSRGRNSESPKLGRDTASRLAWTGLSNHDIELDGHGTPLQSNGLLGLEPELLVVGVVLQSARLEVYRSVLRISLVHQTAFPMLVYLGL